MAFIEYQPGDVVEGSIEITGLKEGGLGRVYFGYCRNRQIKVVIKTLLKSTWRQYRMAERWPEIKRELINRQYAAFVTATGHRHPPHWQKGQSGGFSFPDDKADVPVVNVSYEDAEAYCRWAGLRLPSGDEWEKAARGCDGWLYPWGDEYHSQFCNSAESRQRQPVAVDRYPEGVSPFGCYQMVGNVFEWVDESHPKSDALKYLRGGSWVVSCEVLGPPFLHYIAVQKDQIEVSDQTNIFGFRCARDARDAPVEKTVPPRDDGQDRCPLCGGGWKRFACEDLKVPENNLYTWIGYFDCE